MILAFDLGQQVVSAWLVSGRVMMGLWSRGDRIVGDVSGLSGYGCKGEKVALWGRRWSCPRLKMMPWSFV